MVPFTLPATRGATATLLGRNFGSPASALRADLGGDTCATLAWVAAGRVECVLRGGQIPGGWVHTSLMSVDGVADFAYGLFKFGGAQPDALRCNSQTGMQALG